MGILLTGATGVVGSRIVARLSDRHDVTAIARSDASADRLGTAGIRVVRADLDRPESLPPAFRGVTRLFLLTPYSERQLAQEHAALDAAEEAGVRGVVYLSLISTDLDIAFSRVHAEIEERLAAGPFATTVLRPDFFAQNLHGQAGLIAQGQFVWPAGGTTVAPVDVEDIADAAVVALTAERQPTGTFTLTGPERLTFGAMAERIGAALGRDVAYLDAPADAWRHGLLQAGVSEAQADGLVEMFQAYVRTGGTFVTGGVERITGRPPTNLDDFVSRELVPALANPGG